MKAGAFHVAGAINLPRRVFYTGSDAILQGEGLCYDSDRGTAANVDYTRNSYVEAASTSNNGSFAGVSDAAHAAQTGGRWISINEPGSIALINLVDTTSSVGDDTYATCICKSNTAADVGKFTNTNSGILGGRGNAQILQTLSAAGTCLARLLDGEESYLLERLLPVTSAAAQSMVGGITAIQAVTIAGDSTATLADGTYNGQKKLITMDGAITTSDWVLTVTSGLQNDNSTSLATLTFDAVTEGAYLMWLNTLWHMLAGTATEG